MALIATGTAAISIAVSAVPASAATIRSQEWWLSALDVTGAWAGSQGAGVTVAVLSDGVGASQKDLTGYVTTAPAPPGAPVATGKYFGDQGTAIASLIAGHGHGPFSGSGIVGVAPRAKILSVPVTLPGDDPALNKSAVAAAIPGAIAAGIRYAVSHGASVIDLPLDPGQPGSTGTPGGAAAAGGSAAEQAAVGYAEAHGVVLVAPAGDDGGATDAPNYPAAYRGVIAVGAFNSAFDKASWSSHQSYVTLTAAGDGVIAATNGAGYQTMSSTSAASAIVSGIVALIRSRYPELSPSEIRQALITTTAHRRAGGFAEGSGYGTVNAAGALAAAEQLATPSSDRAGAGAQAAVSPTAGAAASNGGLGSQLLTAGEISAGLLLLLLLLIALYSRTVRRRPSRRAQVAAAWTARPAQSRYPHASPSDADRMLELFATPVAEPQPTAGHADHLPVRAAQGEQGLFGAAADRPLTGAGAAGQLQSAGGQADLPRRTPQGPASRAVAGRPSVSGRPPWEPASAPDGELPWTGAAGGSQSTEFGPAGAGPSSGPHALTGPATGSPAGGITETGLPVRAAAPTDQRRHARHAQNPMVQPGEQRGGEDWYSSQSQPDPPIQPRIAGSGLPVRPARRPSAPAPSPSGSLWEPIESDPRGISEGTQDPSGRPIYVWDPRHGQSPPDSNPGLPPELREALNEWGDPE